MFPVFKKKFLLKFIIKYFVWDFDGTLYQDDNQLGSQLRQAFYQTSIQQQPSLKIDEFDSISQQLGSWSKAASFITQIPEIKILDRVDKKVDKRKYIKKNMAIVKLIEDKTQFHHLILTNSTLKEVTDCLPLIGFKNQPFEKIFSRDNTQLLKPDNEIFSQIISYTKLPRLCHVCIGDSIKSDIDPAKKFGFQAVPIWEISKLFSK